MKRFILAGLTLGLLFLVACGAVAEMVDGNVYERVHRRLVSMEGFSAQATVTYVSNNNTHVYETTQHALATGQYRIEVTSPENVAGNTTIFDGATISQFNPNVGGTVSQTNEEAPERLEILLTSFVRNFITSNEVTVTASTMDESLTTVLETTIPGEHPYISTARLWMCNDRLNPLRMVIFDQSGAERIIVVYNTFEHNPQLPDDLFQVGSDTSPDEEDE
ncbi:MAG: hypothetical protein FWD97_02660 [Defluviitaleaceae bacterium]|nr:hypothetical protein [Defluviitaleaceae bacterium]